MERKAYSLHITMRYSLQTNQTFHCCLCFFSAGMKFRELSSRSDEDVYVKWQPCGGTWCCSSLPVSSFLFCVLCAERWLSIADHPPKNSNDIAGLLAMERVHSASLTLHQGNSRTFLNVKCSEIWGELTWVWEAFIPIGCDLWNTQESCTSKHRSRR